MTWFGANWFRLVIVSALLVTGFISYDVFVTQPRQAIERDEARIAQEKLDEKFAKIEEELKMEETERCV